MSRDWRTLQLGIAGVLGVAGGLAPTLGCVDSAPAMDGDSSSTTDGTESGPTTDGDADSGTDTDSDSDSTGELACWEQPGPWDAGHAIPTSTTPAGDPEAGEWALLHEDYVSCGIPFDMFQLGKGLLGTYADGETLPWREGKAAQLPYNWNLIVSEGGTELAAMNCLTCHAGEFNGEVVFGLGRHDADFTQSVGSLLQPLPEINDAAIELNKFIARYDALGPHIQMKTVGTNPADLVAIVLASHRNPFTLAWSDEQLIPIDPPLIPVDTPPWWRVRKKAGHFYNGMSRGDHRGTMMFASSLCIDDAAQAAEVLEYFDDIRAYLESIEAPEYPWAIDESLAAEGEAVFECTCAGCHGTYADDPAAETFPNLLVPLEVVGTDPSLAADADGEVSLLVDWFNQSWYGTVTQLTVGEPFLGYTAPPLDGIWATAPYFHNASVPTLELVLNSSARPTYWRRVDFDSTNYDQAALGWPYEALEFGQDAAPLADRKYIYDTTIYAHGNGGHPFGDALSEGERAALLEYLKTL